MEQAFDTLAASRKLEGSGMPKRQSDATVEVVSDAMNNLVTKEFLKAELDQRFAVVDRRFTKLETEFDIRFSKIDGRFDKIDAQFDKIDARFGKIDARFGKIDVRFGEVDIRFRDVMGYVDKLEAKTESLLMKTHAELTIGFAEQSRSQAWWAFSLAGFMLAGLALQFAALQYFG